MSCTSSDDRNASAGRGNWLGTGTALGGLSGRVVVDRVAIAVAEEVATTNCLASLAVGILMSRVARVPSLAIRGSWGRARGGLRGLCRRDGVGDRLAV